MHKKIRPADRVIMAVSTLLLLTAFFFPLWTITLEAPQYPEGLSMQIWINKMTGDIQIINGLNHYIGMRHIIPENFKELNYMTYIVEGLIILGLLTVISGRRVMLYFTAAIMLIFGVGAITDFYLWEYDYGHNLDPRAPIKIPGMSYQPPLIGGKQLLNFYATSWPALGGWAIIIAGIVPAILAVVEFFRGKNRRAVQTAIYVGLSMILVSCSPGPQPINYGKDACSYCKMSITDKRFGAEIVTKKGKVFKYDATECMLRSVNEGHVKPEDVREYLVSDASQPGALVDAAKAFYLISEKLPSPMGANISAFGHEVNRQDAYKQFGGRLLSWAELQAEFNRK